MPMTDEEKIRFTQDLTSIYNDIRGESVKNSIWDALEILGRYAGTASGGGSGASFAYTLNSLAGAPVIGDAEPLEV